MKRYLEGIRFGLILQFIIGPMCLLVFHTANNHGFFFTIPLVFVIALVDAIYITLACIGVSKILEKKKFQDLFRIIGSVVLIVFGINTILNVFDINVIPGIQIHPSTKNVVLQGFFLALANPITIMFWGSVLTTKLVDDSMRKRELLLFCLGLVSATILFQLGVAFLGAFVSKLLPEKIIQILNVAVGFFIIYFGFKQLFKNNRTNSAISSK